MGGVDSYREYLVAKEILSYAPDLVILLSGNNENYKRYKVNLTAYYINKFFRKFWTYRKLQDYVANWIKNQESDPLTIREKRLRNYERNVRAVVRLLRSRKVPIVLCTLPGNFKDCPPGGYLPLDKQFILSSFLLENKDYYSAIKGFQEFLVRNPDDRFGLYFLGRAYEGIKEYSKAKEYYLKAWDLGFTGGQAGPTSNEIIRRICREDKAILADFETLFMQVSPYGLCGRNLLYDYCHLHPAAYSLFAECIAQEIFKNKELCVSLFGKTMEIPKSLSSLNEPLDFLQKGDSKWAMLISAWDVVSGGFNENESGYLFDERSISYLETLYLMDPDMFWKLQFFKEEIFSEFSQYPWIREFSLTYNSNSQRLWARLLCYMGETYRRVGEYQKAIVLLDKSIAMNGSNYLPYLDKALIYNALGGQQQSAQENFAQAEKASENDQQKLVIKYYKEILGL
jgi:tetratricopeptide (TPR) repeat protein